jgi:RNA polymerase sigma factor (sigma-70 family)
MTATRSHDSGQRAMINPETLGEYDGATEVDSPDRDEADEADDTEDLPGQAVAEPRSTAAIACGLDPDALAALIARVVRQDEAALATLYDTLCGRVYAVALQVTGLVGTAEEVTQDTFWQVWRQAPRFDPARGNAIAWVLTMARSRALDARRASGRNVLQGLRQVVDEHVEFVDGSASDPLDLLETVQRDSTLHHCLTALDPLRRQLISLVFYRGLTHEEVAQHTGLPLGTVKSHLRRTLSALRQALGPDFNPERVEVQG